MIVLIEDTFSDIQGNQLEVILDGLFHIRSTLNKIGFEHDFFIVQALLWGSVNRAGQTGGVSL